MEYTTYLPHPHLRPYIANYWAVQQNEPSDSSRESCIVPDGNTSLMFIGGALYRRSAMGERALEHKDQSLLVGQKSRPVFYTFPSEIPLKTFGVRFRPLGLSAFLAAPMHEFANAVLDAQLSFGPKINQLQDLLLQPVGLQNCINPLDNFFLQRLQPLEDNYLKTNMAVQKILRKRGHIKITYLAAKLNISTRQLERLFKHYMGLPPKTFCKIIRFNYCLYLKNSRQFQTLTDLAYANGYFDQMHFIKEFKSFTDQTPRQYFKSPQGLDSAFHQILERRFLSIKTSTFPTV